MRVRLTPQAAAEIETAARWYEAQREGLGVQFNDRVVEATDKIAVNPLGHRKVIEEARRINLRKFPYALWYAVEKDAVVIACLHAKRGPVLARERAFSVIPIKPPVIE